MGTVTKANYNKNLLQANVGNLSSRRVSTISNNSSDFLLSSPNAGLFKRKRKLMDQNNKASDQFIQRINKHEEKRLSKQNSRLSESTEDDCVDMSNTYSKTNKPASLKLTDQSLNNYACSSLSSKSSTCSSSSAASSSSFSMSSDSSMNELCSKSLIFAPKILYNYKERLFRKSLSEKKSKEKAEKNRANIHYIFSPRYIPKNKHLAVRNGSTQTPASKTNIVEATLYNDSFIAAQGDTPLLVKSNLNPSKVLDEIIENQSKSNRLHNNASNENTANDSQLNGSLLRRRKLFDPKTFDVDQAFDSSHHQVCKIHLRSFFRKEFELNFAIFFFLRSLIKKALKRTKV